jgi:hypothetical protein
LRDYPTNSSHREITRQLTIIDPNSQLVRPRQDGRFT